MYVADILKAKGAEVVTILPSAGIEAAAKVLRDRKFGALVVADKAGSMVGIMSERDIIRIVGDMGTKGLGLRVEDIMTRSVRTAKPTDTLEDLANLMAKHRIRHAPVMDNAKLVGVVSQTDLIKYSLAEQDEKVRVMKNLNIAKK